MRATLRGHRRYRIRSAIAMAAVRCASLKNEGFRDGGVAARGSPSRSLNSPLKTHSRFLPLKRSQAGEFRVVDRAEARPVKVAHQNATTAVISEGLKKGERVVTKGGFLLEPGAQVATDSGRGS